MKRYTTITIAGQLRAASQLIANTRMNIEIQALVATRGYGEQAIAEGQRLYDAAVQAVDVQNARAGALRQATEQVRVSERDARAAYQALAQTVRALFGPNSHERKALDLHGRTPDSTTAFLGAAATLFNNALNLSEIGKTLALYGYDQAALLRGRNIVQRYEELLQQQAGARSSAMHATSAQAAALEELYRWTAQYAKLARIALRERPDLLLALGIAPQRRATAVSRATP